MALRMTSPCKPGRHGVYYFRKRVPADLRGTVGKAEVKFSLGTKNPAEAKKLCREADEQVSRRWDFLRAQAGPLPLKTILGLAGRAYSRFVELMDEEPGEPRNWEVLIARAEHEARGNLEGWYGITADSLLEEIGQKADERSRRRLLEEIHQAIVQASKLNQRKAHGDYRPDPMAERFPKVFEKEGQTQSSDDSVTFNQLFAAWKKSGRSANQKTVADWKSTLDNFKGFLGHDNAKRVSPRDVKTWTNHLIESGLKARTVKEKKVAAVRAIYRAAVGDFLVEKDPTQGVKIVVPRQPRNRQKGFSDEEAKRILMAALKGVEVGKRTEERLKLAYRWLPWISSYTGARAGELAQLRKEDVRTDHGIPYIRITPEAGAVKNKQYRDVPLHPDLVQQGFLDFVSHRPDGPLFYHARKERKNAIRGPWENVRDKVGQWTKKVWKISDEDLSPTHAWRHRFKTLCRRYGVDMTIADAIQGHAAAGVAANYGDIPLEVLNKAIRKLPTFPPRD